jgi:hypothetical protein
MWGTFTGDDHVALIGHRATVMQDIGYTSPDGAVHIVVPQGFTFDGASIPVFAWSLVGHPFLRGYRRPAAVHDFLCRERVLSSAETHRLFYYGLRAEGVSVWKCHVLYRIVQAFGPRW